MKNVMIYLVVLMPLLASAQNFSGADAQNMQAMMQKAKEMQLCMQKVDQVKMQAFQQRAKQLGEELKALCSAGKRTEALNKAMSYSNEMASDSAMQEVKRCAEIMQGFMPDISNVISDYQKDRSKKHFCDNGG